MMSSFDHSILDKFVNFHPDLSELKSKLFLQNLLQSKHQGLANNLVMSIHNSIMCMSLAKFFKRLSLICKIKKCIFNCFHHCFTVFFQLCRFKKIWLIFERKKLKGSRSYFKNVSIKNNSLGFVGFI